jgi:glycosyltransferase involved in cell wall biosynthesis
MNGKRKYDQLSVVVPVFNTPARWLSDCISSIEHQSFQSLDILIVNDGSTNSDTLDYLHALEGSGKHRIIHKMQNGGVASALNEGLYNARNELVAVTGSDDIMVRDRLKRQMDFMNTYPEVSLFGTGMIYFSEDEKNAKKLLGLGPPHPSVVTREIALANPFWFINAPTVIHKKSEILSLGGYNETLREYAEDYELWIRMLKNGMIIHNTLEPLHYYRIHDNNLSRKYKDDHHDFLLRTRDKLRE